MFFAANASDRNDVPERDRRRKRLTTDKMNENEVEVNRKNERCAPHARLTRATRTGVLAAR
jgi:hypothetical protein